MIPHFVKIINILIFNFTKCFLKGSSDVTCTFTSCLNWNVCWQCVYTQPPYNDKDPPSVFFYLVKSFPLSHIKPFSDACLCDVTQTQAPPSIVDWH